MNGDFEKGFEVRNKHCDASNNLWSRDKEGPPPNTTKNTFLW